MTPEATPLVLLVLLAFFFVVALAFTVWAALTVGDAAKRTHQRQADDARLRAERRPAREPKPWEKKPAPTKAQARRSGAVQETLWQAKSEAQPAAPAKPARVEPARTEPAAGATEQRGGRAVVTPRQPNTDAFERFLESEKRRD